MYFGIFQKGDLPEMGFDWGVGCNKRQANILYQLCEPDTSGKSILQQLDDAGLDLTTLQISIKAKEKK